MRGQFSSGLFFCYGQAKVSKKHKVFPVAFQEFTVYRFIGRKTAAGIEEPEVECDPVLLMHRVAELAVRFRCCVLFARDAGTAAAMAWHLFCVRLDQVKGGQKR